MKLCATTDGEWGQLKNVKVDAPVLYLELNWNEADQSKQLVLVYRNDDEMVNQPLLLNIK